MKVHGKSSEKINILLLDDHQMLLDIWSFILQKDGRFAIVAKTTSGSAAIEIAKTNHPDVAIVDINIGEPDGFEVTKQIRRFSPGTRIIVISMYALPAYEKKMRSLGAMGYVTKGSPAEELINAIIEVHNGKYYYCKQMLELMKCEAELITNEETNLSSLTQREIEIIQLIGKGLTSKEIARKLFLSAKTINIHRHNIFRKLNVKNVSSLIATAQKMGL